MMESSIDIQPMLDVAPVAPSNNRRKKWLVGGLTVLLIAAAATIGVVVGRSTAGSSSETTPVLKGGMAYREVTEISEGMAYRESLDLDLDVDYDAADNTEIDMLKISKSGTTEVAGRVIDWKTRMYTKGLKVRYSSTATDRATGIQGSSSNHKSGTGATEHAVKDCFEKLAANGHLQVSQLEGAVNSIAINDESVESSDDVEINVSELLGKSKSGTTDVYGRQIHWKASAYMRGLKLRYKATATDKQSGISGSSSNHKSGKGAVEQATKQCFEKMIAAGVIPAPPQAALEAVPVADAEFPLDVSEADIAEEIEEKDLLKISKSGTTEVAGRVIDWKTRLYTKGLKVRYSATATDRATGIQGSSSNHKSGKGATETAVKDCFEKLAAAGHLQVTPALFSVNAAELVDGEVEEEQPLLRISKSGTTEVAGRVIDWKTRMYTKGLKGVRYSSTATDRATGIQGSSAGHKSGKGATEHAVKDCFEKLAAAGHLQAAPALVTVNNPEFEDNEAITETNADDLLKISKSGTTEVAGRIIDWKTRLYTKGLKVRYSATATDRATGIQGSSSNHKSGKGATETAVKQCFEKLAAAGHLQVTPALVSVELADEEVEEEQPVLRISKSGTEIIAGRTVDWHTRMYTKGLKGVRYSSTATDRATGIQGSSAGHKSGKGATEHAVQDLFAKLAAAGHLQAAPALVTVNAPELEDNEAIVEADADEEQPLLKISKSGTETVLGRVINWKSTLYMRGLKVRYKATATDRASGIQGSSSNHKSGKGSVEAAVKDCFQKLVAAGIVTP